MVEGLIDPPAPSRTGCSPPSSLHGHRQVSTGASSATGWAELLGRHHAVVRRELERFRGREIDTAGDGFLASFDGPARAIRCAVAARDAVQGLGLEIRAGLHTGECELLGDKVAGIAVHTGARVSGSSLAGSGLRDGSRPRLRLGDRVRGPRRARAQGSRPAPDLHRPARVTKLRLGDGQAALPTAEPLQAADLLPAAAAPADGAEVVARRAAGRSGHRCARTSTAAAGRRVGHGAP